MINEDITPALVNSTRWEETTTQRFNPIQTSEVLGNLEKLGWEPTATRLTRTRVKERQPFARHLVTLKRSGSQVAQVGDSIPRINLRNANDGTSSFEMFAGFYRLICLNGLMVGTHYTAVKVRHSLGGEKLAEALAVGISSTEEQIAKAESVIREWQRITLTPNQQAELARFAVGLRWGSYFSPQNLPKIKEAGGSVDQLRKEVENRAVDLLNPRRGEDVGSSLWLTFNRIQENVMRGGFDIVMPRNTRQGLTLRPRKVRLLTAINESVRINRALWDGAEALAHGGPVPAGQPLILEA